MKLTKKCPYCGTVMPTGARQCMFCGQMQPDNDATQLQGGNNDATQYQGSNNDATQYQGSNNDATQYQESYEDTQRMANQQNGSPQGGVYPQPTPPPLMYGPPPISKPQEKNGSNKKILFILLAALLLIGGGVGAYFLLKDKGESASTKTTEHKVITGEDTKMDEKGGTKDEDEGMKEKIEPVKEEPVKEEDKPAPPSETTNYYNYTGNITYKSNVYNFRMNLTVKGNNVSGDYIVTNGENVWVTLSGTVDSSGKVKIWEYKGGSPTSYYFEGYLNSSSFSGKYKTTSRPLVMDFHASSY